MSNLSKNVKFFFNTKWKESNLIEKHPSYRRNIEGHTFNASKKDWKETWLICNIQKLVVNHKNYCIFSKTIAYSFLLFIICHCFSAFSRTTQDHKNSSVYSSLLNTQFIVCNGRHGLHCSPIYPWKSELSWSGFMWPRWGPAS